MSSTKLKHAEKLLSQTGAKDQIKVDSSEFDLPEFDRIEGTPFHLVVHVDEKEFGIAWGRFRITENMVKYDKDPMAEAIDWIDSNIVNVMVIVSTIVIQHNIQEALVNTEASIRAELNKIENQKQN